MKKNWPYLVTALIVPLIGMTYLYTRNVDQLSLMSVLVVCVAMVVISLIGYGVLRLIFRSSAAAMVGCLTAWIGFFGMVAGLAELLKAFTRNNLLIYGIYAVATILLALLAAFLVRRYKGSALGTISLTMACIMLLFNGFPAVQSAISIGMHAKEETSAHLKTEFSVDASSPSPNVYWIHADGMLGVDAMAKYFGDDQAELLAALAERGFSVNRSAHFEAGHMTRLAIPALFNPTFYDEELGALLSTSESAIALRSNASYILNDTMTARVQNETRLAFASKGYETQTLSIFDVYYPPVTDRFYMTDDPRGVYQLKMEDPESTIETIVDIQSLSLLFKIPKSTIFKVILRLSDMLGLGVSSEKLTHTLTADERLRLVGGNPNAIGEARMFDALYDALETQASPTLSLIMYMTPHRPYKYLADGSSSAASDSTNYLGYAQNHEYSGKVLLNMVDMILEHDPDAVIVIQADHGLHTSGNDDRALTAEFGEASLLDFWNQVMSAVRVPESYQNGEESHMMDTPLNISRYLMNRFVGEQYNYLPAA